jgi:isochorismate synthase EntC
MTQKNQDLINELAEREKTLREQSLVLEQINNKHA